MTLAKDSDSGETRGRRRLGILTRWPALAACFALLTGCVDDDLLDYDCSVFTPPESSPYILPWTVGHRYTSIPHAVKEADETRYAIDTLMPIGTAILAITGGEVTALGEVYVDGDHEPGHENFVILDHGDGTAALYAHLTHMGAAVELGDIVSQGDVIGQSGDTGDSTAPHLHFSVVDCSAPAPVDSDAFNSCATIPLSFRNSKPVSACGLQHRVPYTALPF